ncbi:unnamed protein product [Hermetia illucens]|uniref:Farnesoic acid O-methyl transferase domain-containing protein n=1 Tax=Hermetia illucens TaxID=343691 RepID=A0A7R8UJT8_HERIL|nr:uncharacterized protein LOC119649572 [Hermetia illucens]CAD7081949.1 unnamed protein product [Hermetia illucens]
MYATGIVIFVTFILFCARFSDSVHDRNPVPFSKLATCQEFDIDSHKCLHFFPLETIKNYQTKEYKLHLKFYVMATNDANIVLTNGYGEGTVRYTAVIAGGGNTYSWLRNTSDTTLGLESHLTDILSPLWPTPIVVRQKTNGLLDVSIPGVAEPLLLADASDLTEVKSFCLYAWRNKSRWFYNCTESEDILLDKNTDCNSRRGQCQLFVGFEN